MMTIDEVKQGTIEDKAEIIDMFAEASAYISSHGWCGGLERIRFAGGFAHVAVFFATVLTTTGETGDDFWVIVGDVPPLYLDTADGAIDNAADALDGYAEVMEIWVEAASGIENEWKVPPVVTRKSLKPVKPSKEYADMLGARLSFIRDKVVPAIRDQDY